MEFKFGKAIPYHIDVRATNNFGIIVAIGCGIFCFNDPSDAADFIGEYLRRPTEMEKCYGGSDTLGDSNRKEFNEPVLAGSRTT